MPLRFGLNGATTGSTDLLTDLRVAHAAGYEALEVRDGKLAAYLDGGGSLYTLRQKLSDLELEALSVNALRKTLREKERGASPYLAKSGRFPR